MPNFLVHRLSHIPALLSVPHHTSPFPSLFSLYPPLPPKADSFWFRSDTLFRRLFVVPGMPHTLWLCRLVRVVSALLKTNKVSTWMFGAHASFSGRTCRIHPAGGQSWVCLDFMYIFFFMALRSNGGQDLLNQEATRSHSDTPHSVGPLFTSDQPDADTSDNTPYSQQICMPPRGVRTHNLSRRTAADRGCWDRNFMYIRK